MPRENPRTSGSRPSRSNYTGRQQQALVRENAEEIAARSAEMSMVGQAPGVIDFDDLLETPDEPGEFEPVLRDSTGETLVEEMAPPKRRGILRDALEVAPGDDLNRRVEVVANDDYPEVTIGFDQERNQPNTFDLKRGHKYRLPVWAAQHLERQEMLL
jgi:hypothetical protein